jgi:hypothetical protein
MGPIDYSLNIANPLNSVLQGFQLGRQMRQEQEQQRRAEAERERAIQKQQAQAALAGNPNATFGDYRKVMQMFPEETKALTEQWSAMDKVAKETMFSAGADAFALIRPGADGKIDAAPAAAKLEEYAAAADNSGDKQGAQKFRDMAAFVKANPDAGRATIGTVLSAWDPERAKKLMDFGSGGDVADLDKGYALNVKLYGKAQADAWRQAEEAKKGIITSTGPLGTSYVPALKVAPMLAAGTVAGTAPESPGPVETRADGNPAFLTPAQYQATVAAMGKERTDEYLKTNGIAVIEDKSTVSGKTYYKIGGKWFDNPEGR